MKIYRILSLCMSLSFCSVLLADAPSRVQEINQEIDSLKKEIHEQELQSMKLEIMSENYMKYEWDKYTQEIEKVEKVEQHIQVLQKQLKTLETEKADLIKSGTTP